MANPEAAIKFDAAVDAYERSDWDAARTLASEAMLLDPQHPGALYITGTLELDAGEARLALPKLLSAASIAPTHGGIQRSLARAHAALEQWDAALAAYDNTVRLSGPDASLFSEVGLILHELEDWDKAVMAFNRSIELDPTDADVYNNLAVTLNRKHDYKGAAAVYKRAHAIDPANVDVLSNLAMLFEQMNELEEAEHTAATGLKLMPSHGILNLVAARCERRRDEFTAAIDRIERVLADTRTPLQARRGLHFELGRDYDSLGQIPQAFQHFSAGNHIATELWPDMVVSGHQYLAELDAMLASLDETVLRVAPGAEAPAGLSPVFLVGFPRSGTTLMDTILGSHPDVAVMEEEPPLHRVHEAILAKHGADPRAVLGLSAAELAELRRLYWSEAARHLGDDVVRTARVVVDKNPFYSTRALLIHRLFPDARFIFALRHPCAVILSCFMQPFGRNPALSNFVDLMGSAQTYQRVMRIWLRFRATLPLATHELRYESLVSDKERHIRETLEFLGLDWDETLLDHVAQAQRRGRIYTPSYHQVTRPIYTDSINRWRNYRDYFGDAYAVLEPFIRGFGYEP